MDTTKRIFEIKSNLGPLLQQCAVKRKVIESRSKTFIFLKLLNTLGDFAFHKLECNYPSFTQLMWGYRDKSVLTYMQCCDKTFPVSKRGKANECTDLTHENLHYNVVSIMTYPYRQNIPLSYHNIMNLYIYCQIKL